MAGFNSISLGQHFGFDGGGGGYHQSPADLDKVRAYTDMRQRIDDRKRVIASQRPQGIDVRAQNIGGSGVLSATSAPSDFGSLLRPRIRSLVTPLNSSPSSSTGAPAISARSLPFRGSTSAELAEFDAGDPTRTAAGTGATTLTPYGTASSRTATRDEIAEPPMTPISSDRTATGVIHGDPGSNWQKQVVANHPEIGVAGSPANLAYVAAHKAATAAGQPFDPHQLAADTMQGLRPNTDSASPATAHDDLPSSRADVPPVPPRIVDESKMTPSRAVGAAAALTSPFFSATYQPSASAPYTPIKWDVNAGRRPLLSARSDTQDY